MLSGGSEDQDVAVAMLEELRSIKEQTEKMAENIDKIPDRIWEHINKQIDVQLGKSARRMIQMAVVAIGMFFAVMMLPWDKFK